MKLLTHNILTSNVIKGVKNGYPLKLSVESLKTKTILFNDKFIVKMLPRIDWTVLVSAVKQAGYKAEDKPELPEKLVDDYESNIDFLKLAHHYLVEVEVETGHLECPETGRQFTIKNGIPNMLLQENEVERS